MNDLVKYDPDEPEKVENHLDKKENLTRLNSLKKMKSLKQTD